MTRNQREHQLRGIAITSRRMLNAVYAVTFDQYPPADMPDDEVIQEILKIEFPRADTQGPEAP